jgi:hypothetical protein
MFGKFFRELFGIEKNQEIEIDGQKYSRPRCNYCSKPLSLYEVRHYEDTCGSCYAVEEEDGINWDEMM